MRDSKRRFGCSSIFLALGILLLICGIVLTLYIAYRCENETSYVFGNPVIQLVVPYALMLVGSSIVFFIYRTRHLRL